LSKKWQALEAGLVLDPGDVRRGVVVARLAEGLAEGDADQLGLREPPDDGQARADGDRGGSDVVVVEAQASGQGQPLHQLVLVVEKHAQPVLIGGLGIHVLRHHGEPAVAGAGDQQVALEGGEGQLHVRVQVAREEGDDIGQLAHLDAQVLKRQVDGHVRA
jgi:hypothetical protein